MWAWRNLPSTGYGFLQKVLRAFQSQKAEAGYSWNITCCRKNRLLFTFKENIFPHLLFFLFPTNFTGDKSFLLLCSFRFDIDRMHLTKDTDNLAKCFHFLKKVILGDYFLSILLFFLQYFFFSCCYWSPFFSTVLIHWRYKLWKVKGVHILFMFTLFLFPILLGFCNSGYLHNSLHKRRKMPQSSVLLKPQLLCSWAHSWLLLLYDRM